MKSNRNNSQQSNLKSIILFRHGEYDMNSKYGHNHDCPLTNVGIKEAEMMGKYLETKNQVPDYIISSTAVRAQTTLKVAIASGEWSCPLVLESGIYGGSPQFLLNMLRRQNNTLSSICLVGHEPNFSSFIKQATNSVNIYFPTASMAKIDFNIDNWLEIAMGVGNLDWLVRPDEL